MMPKYYSTPPRPVADLTAVAAPVIGGLLLGSSIGHLTGIADGAFIGAAALGTLGLFLTIRQGVPSRHRQTDARTLDFVNDQPRRPPLA